MAINKTYDYMRAARGLRLTGARRWHSLLALGLLVGFTGGTVRAEPATATSASNKAAGATKADKQHGEEPQYPEFVDGVLPTTDGFRGIWYANQKSNDEYVYKYSGGKATYPHQHHPIAIYRPEVDKTFFVWGGRYKDQNTLLHMISYFDHKTKMVARPRVLLDKRTSDAHDNPTICIDNDGYIFIFSSAHGTSRPSYIHRSMRPYDISEFDHVLTTNFSYTQPWYLPEYGFVFMHTRYLKGQRVLHVMTSPDGEQWSEPLKFAHIQQGHYQVTQPFENSIASAFNLHPDGQGLNWRTNLYYIQSDDGGKTWHNVQGEKLTLPLTDRDNPALVKDYQAEGRLCYMKCLRFTPEGHPVILHLTSDGYESGPENDPRTFTTARWTGKEWDFQEAMPADNNYDFASLDILPNGDWLLLGDTQPGPQAYNTGGEIALWKSTDQGQNWNMVRQLTKDSKYNHLYPRKPVNADDDFFAFWADGHARKPSESRLYFTDREGSAVWMLPPEIEEGEGPVKPIRMPAAGTVEGT
ncbi:BNR repeat-containing protein [Aeoliella sp. ICT_H6.2]|uniref:BNR repeat-containing protein n=1 Tax=Aeoliella straminimaris TaxID=2954799 RepID=A0A9X2F9B4_9BACT|nr:BNR-4 repeat-containing protein [Aeoliella straminimaris]MCO6044259.1 BNR repeat-containing protein [Aeoliella straminimaris]